ncbi:hypothetical protein [Clostridium drakei]|uniref:Uncharacterized protein n=1 Tax=Clostridium drakei TaxID=332101 RepID=A0A2U8DM59_9CLOT|nr:hypothetical protein [Clostridium drakei]AWI03284.1 hypothetical protein B9W14_01825 [Clostridium drakei]
MSLFLGKIHYWLFDKIKWFEGLESEIVNFAEAKNLPVDNWKEEIYKNFGYPIEDKPLEDMIDTSNIHGWLQDKISKSEGRHAAWITKILSSSQEYKEDLINIFENQGNELGTKYRENMIPNTPEEIYNIINDFILEGMPCDRVSEELENNSELYMWKTNLCLHSKYWDSVHGDVNNFYILRDVWIESFVKALNSNFLYSVIIVNNKRVQQIKKIS